MKNKRAFRLKYCSVCRLTEGIGFDCRKVNAVEGAYCALAFLKVRYAKAVKAWQMAHAKMIKVFYLSA